MTKLVPSICVMKNVPGMLSIENRNVADVVRTNFDEAGYSCTYSLVNAEWFGVPQERQPLIFIATRRDLGMTISVSKLEALSKIFCQENITLSRETTVADVIRDLPKITNGALEDPLILRWSVGRPSQYSQLMREGSNGLLKGHVCRKHNDQDLKAFSVIKQGMKYYQSDVRFRRYRDDIFRDKYKKLGVGSSIRNRDGHLAWIATRTSIRTNPGTVSIRETARLQSFPDCFRFCGKIGEHFCKIGNAVPPLMAWGIAEL